MSDPTPSSRNLGEIGHLFLSAVRARHTNGARTPQRQPPSAFDLGADLTPDEYAHVLGLPDEAAQAIPPARLGALSAVIGPGNGRPLERAIEYARHLAATKGRVGLVALDASEFRLMCFERQAVGLEDADAPEVIETQAAGATELDFFDTRAMTSALRELAWDDIDHWLIVLPNWRTVEARGLLRDIGHWVLLATPDEEGLVCAYRTIKGLCDLPEPTLSVALLDAPDEGRAGAVHAKLANVARQFLHWTLQIDSVVTAAPEVSEHLVLCCRPSREKAQLAVAPQWKVVADFLEESRVQAVAATDAPAEVSHIPQIQAEAPMDIVPPVPPSMPVETPAAPVMAPPAIPPITPSAPVAATWMPEVIDLPTAGIPGILSAVMNGSRGELVECAVPAPVCAEVRLAVNRERRLVLLGVVSQGLAQLRAIAEAYRWLTENRALVAMAVPQHGIDPHQHPHLRLLIDQVDQRADVLLPLLANAHVRLLTYRTLRWGAKTGLLLEAA